jgi:DNA-binding NarL/FixJ family response regulator
MTGRCRHCGSRRPVSCVGETLPAPAALALLTARELEIARLVSLGQRNGAIALELGIATVTVKNHLQRVMRKLDLESRMQLMLWFIGNERVIAPPYFEAAV